MHARVSTSFTHGPTELAEQFAAHHPGAEVPLNGAGSSAPVQQSVPPASTDVLAAAHGRGMAGAVDGDRGREVLTGAGFGGL